MIGDYRVTDQGINNIYENGLLTKPTPFHSMYKAGQGGFITGYKFAGDIYRKAVGLPENKELNNTMKMIERETHFEGQSGYQTLGNWVVDMIGYSLNPAVIALGGAGGLAARGLSIGARAIVPKAIIPFLEKKVGTTTVGQIGERLASGVAIGEFSAIPQAFEEGSANVAHAGGGIGFAISSIPILLGLRRGLRLPVEKQKLEAEVPIKLSEEDKWHHDYENKLDTPENLQVRATKILHDQGFKVDPVIHKVEFNLLNDTDVKNLQTAVTDSIVSDTDPAIKNHLVDYIINNKLDEIKSNPKSQAILTAYDNYISGKILSKEYTLAEADRIHFKNMSKKITNKEFLSQPEIYKAVKKLSHEESHVSQLPFTMPESLEKRLKIERRIKELKAKPFNKKVEARIKELEGRIPKVLTPKEELEDISHKLLVEKQYRMPLQSRSYQRLQELADHWPQAKSLFDRVKLEAEFEKQEAIRNVLDKIRKVVDSPMQDFADPNKVIEYMRNRLDIMKPKQEPIGKRMKSPEQKISESSKVPSDVETITEEQKQMIDEMLEKAPNMKQEYSLMNKKINQFKKNEKVLNDYIKCVLGAS